MERKYYELTTKDIVEAIKAADRDYKVRFEQDPYMQSTDVHDLWLLQSALRFAYLRAKEIAKKKFTPFKYRN